MITSLFILYIAEVLERFAFYSMRAILLLFLMSSLQWTHDEAISIYGLYSGILFISPLFCGILSDLTRRPVLISIIGISLATIGCLAVGFGSDPMIIRTSLVIMALGTALFKPGIVSALYQTTRIRKHRFDFYYTIFYALVNVGAFLGAGSIILLFDNNLNETDFRIAFMIAACGFGFTGLLLLSFYKTLENRNKVYHHETEYLTSSNVLMIVFGFIGCLIFWTAFSLFSMTSGHPTDPTYQTHTAIFGLIVVAAIIPMNLIQGFGTGYKLAIGFLLAGLTYGLFATVQFNGLPAMYVLTIGEMLVGPLLLSAVVVNGSHRFTGTLVGGFLLMTYFANGLASLLQHTFQEDSRGPWWIFTLLILGLGAVYFILQKLRDSRSALLQ